MRASATDKLGYWQLPLAAIAAYMLTLHFAAIGLSEYKTSSGPSALEVATAGRLLTPCEIYWDSVVRVALEELRSFTSSPSLWQTAMQHCWSNHQQFRENDSRQSFALTLVGNKGGKLIDQVNQDRSFVYHGGRSCDDCRPTFSLSGVMDGHGDLGHLVAEYARHELIGRLTTKLLARPHRDSTINAQIIAETVMEIDRDLPRSIMSDGGSTASFAVLLHNHVDHSTEEDDDATLYLANTGDSQSFAVAVVLSSANTASGTKVQVLDTLIPFNTTLHKPELPVERARLEAAGMVVEVDRDGEGARAWYEASDGKTYGLAMSRALGDREAKGVTAEPEISVLKSLRTMAKRVAQEYNEKQREDLRRQQLQECHVENGTNGVTKNSRTCPTAILGDEGTTSIEEDQIRFFVVHATDGLLDYLTPDKIAFRLAVALYETNTEHAMLAATDLMHQSLAQWHVETRGTYRDDMALAVVQIS